MMTEGERWCDWCARRIEEPGTGHLVITRGRDIEDLCDLCYGVLLKRHGDDDGGNADCAHELCADVSR